MALEAILFGSIGTIVETSELQRAAFNKAFAEHNLDWNWDRETYRRRLASSGGTDRISAFALEQGATVDVEAIHAAKTRIFDADIITASLEPRSGVLEVIRSARGEGLKLGFVTSTSRNNIEAIFTALGNTLTEDDFDFVGDSSMVENSKPAPDIYLEALTSLDIPAENAIAIEDSEPSLLAAAEAHIRCIAFPGENTLNQDFSLAEVITTSLTLTIFR
ncbi:HAD family hydrolase [Pseudahrensia aquimaris]|uniref:HAD family hydrolase n=1 Tax=Pseudahrensia aquimaris TaxID=744461 RepID=A0ABW3FDB4_9HYPH